METIAKKYELICYGCTQRSQMNQLLNADDSGYKDIPGPFTDLPSSLLEDLTEVIYDKRGLPKETLHQLILPQLEVNLTPCERPLSHRLNVEMRGLSNVKII